MSLEAGTKLGIYEIVEGIGAGGMGEVYRARDVALGRDVAIKTLRPEYASDPERLRRFEGEARAASALNHPNIIHIYAIGEHEGTPYIAMEYVEGRTLRDVLADGAIPTKELLALATQIAAGLSKAHAAGIVHRDLKPENLIVTADGYVMILDFGLAKLLPEPVQVDSDMMTRDRLETRQGVIVGTVQYMSPEQARGSGVDVHSDQFAFGSILYEMATGDRAFQRDSLPQTMAAIIEDEPAPIRDPEVPLELIMVVERCLKKDPAKRFPTTAELASALRGVPATSSPWSARRSFLWGAAAVIAVVVAVVAGLNLERSIPEEAAIDSLVVLPLRNASGDPEQEYLSDGITEALITDLAKLGSLKVISRTSAMRYKDTDKALAEIASELDVDAVIEGSTLRAGDRVQITVQLVDIDSETARWSERYERDFGDLIRLQGELARTVAREIQADVLPEQLERFAHRGAVNPQVYDAVLKGRFHASKLTSSDLDTALDYFELALEQAPDYAPAYVGISQVWARRSQMGFAPPSEAQPKAMTAALKALELDDTLAEAHQVMAARLTWGDWDWPAAEKEWQRALELDPNSEDLRGYSHFLSIVGRSDEALRTSERALALDPFNAMTMGFHGVNLLLARRYQDAVEQFEKALVTAPRMPFVNLSLVEALHCLGEKEAALARLRSYVEQQGDVAGLDALTDGYQEGGYPEAMSRYADVLAPRALQTGRRSLEVARIYSFAGERERALDWLERGVEVRDPNAPYIRAGAWHDLLGNEPRYRDLLRQMKLPE